MAAITDGTSNTLLVVEGESAVPWTKPVDIPYSAAGTLPQFGGLFPVVFHAAFADGAVVALDKLADESALRGLITRADGQPVDREAFTDPVLTADPEQLRRENRELEAEIERAGRELAELKRRTLRELLERPPGGGQRSPVDVLRLEQKRLLRERDQLRRQIEQLRGPTNRPATRPPGDGGND
jgi:hypothetical protein